MERNVYSQNSHIQCWLQTDSKYVLASLLRFFDQSCIEFMQLCTEITQSKLTFVKLPDNVFSQTVYGVLFARNFDQDDYIL